jgi:hypothetical protein
MTKYYLRTEGVNLYAFIQDTNELSTIRGSGLLMLRSTEKINEEFTKEAQKKYALKVISSGASVGIFSFEAENDDEAEEFRQNVAKFLRNGIEGLKDATFVVSVRKATDDFVSDNEILSARNRWRQFQQPTAVIPDINTDTSLKACEFDKVRAGTVPGPKKIDKRKISQSVKNRRDYGNDKKQSFYSEELKKRIRVTFDAEFVSNFEELTEDSDRGNLNHKSAVIYLDGNGFGKIRDTLCKTEKDLNDFDTKLKKYQATALKRVLDMMKQDQGKLRLETLLWGGDELIWVVPAWKGWEVLCEFYQTAARWEFMGEKLTFAGGMVFCHHNSPIHRITKLCHDLADKAKSVSRKDNMFQYVVLESFDHIGDDLDEYRKRQCPIEWKTTLRGESMEQMAIALNKFKKVFSRGQIYNAIHSALEDSRKNTTDYSKLFIKRIGEILPKEAIDEAMELQDANYFGNPPGLWLHIADLWDYIPEQEAAR